MHKSNSLQLFPSERRVYSRKALEIHRRNGDADDRSYDSELQSLTITIPALLCTVHPECEFCDIRFFDGDELYRHMRLEHYHCSVCENDGEQARISALFVRIRRLRRAFYRHRNLRIAECSSILLLSHCESISPNGITCAISASMCPLARLRRRI